MAEERLSAKERKRQRRAEIAAPDPVEGTDWQGTVGPERIQLRRSPGSLGAGPQLSQITLTRPTPPWASGRRGGSGSHHSIPRSSVTREIRASKAAKEAAALKAQSSEQRLQQSRDIAVSGEDLTAKFKQSSSLFGTRLSTQDALVRSSEVERRVSTEPGHRGVVVHEVPFHEEFQGLFSICYSPAGDILACGYGNGALQLRWSDGAIVKHTVRSGSGNSSVPVMCIRFNRHKTDLFYAASACGTIFACHASSGEFTRFAKEEKNEVNALDVDTEGQKLVTGGRDAKVRIYDVQTEKLTFVYETHATMGAIEPNFRPVHSERVFAVRFHPLLQFVFLTGGWDNAVKIWDIRHKKKCINTFFGPHICGDGLDIKNDTVVTGSWTIENSLQLWDLRMFKKIEDVKPTNRITNERGEFLYVAKFFEGDPYGDMVMVAGSGLPNVEIISLREKKVIGYWSSDNAIYAMDSHRNFIAFGGQKPVIKICDFV